MIGNDFVAVTPKQHPPVATPQPIIVPQVPVIALESPSYSVPITRPIARTKLPNIPFGTFLDLLHRYSLASFAALFLLVGSSAITVANRYYTAHIETTRPVSSMQANHHSIAGLNLSVPHDQLQAKIQSIISQPATFTVGNQAMSLNPDRIKGWLHITTSQDGSQNIIHVNASTIDASMQQLASRYAKDPVNQVSINHADGSSQVVVAGRDGSKLADLSTLTSQSQQYAKTLMDAKGMQFTTPLQTLPFQAVTQASFSKLIEVNVVSKQMYLYDNGQLTHTYPVSAGAPETPTPIGEYHIYSKLAVQDMKGTYPKPYLQPHVHWINYFLPGGYAVHGNYWRPTSWFGVINSSHGCVSLPDVQAKEVYDWAPLGTTVITHA